MMAMMLMMLIIEIWWRGEIARARRWTNGEGKHVMGICGRMQGGEGT